MAGRILIVDDSPPFCAMAAELLAARGFELKSSGQSHDTAIQRRLWTVSDELTGVTFPL